MIIEENRTEFRNIFIIHYLPHRMPDIRSVASVLEPANSSSECVRDPTSVQAVVAALQQAQVGKGIKRGSCYMVSNFRFFSCTEKSLLPTCLLHVVKSN